jgi:hypothetical protein
MVRVVSQDDGRLGEVALTFVVFTAAKISVSSEDLASSMQLTMF